MSTDFNSIPIIDISCLYSEDLSDRLKVAERLGQAARNVGFLYVQGHGVDPEIVQGIRDAARDFFSQDFGYKMKYYIGNSTSHKGFVPEGEEYIDEDKKPDHKEAFDVGFEVPAEHELAARVPLLGPNHWPNLPQFQERASTYYDRILQLGRKLFQGFALALGLDEHYFDSMTTIPPSTLRLVHYPHDESAKDALGISAHTDYEFMTILLADAPGLEVMNDSGKWIDAPPVKDSFVVNIGDMLEVLTGGEFTATAHRVRAVSEERYSFPFFYTSDYDRVVEPLPKFATPEAIQKYRPIKSGEHLWSQYQQTFKYVIKKVASGEMEMNKDAKKVRSFGHFNKVVWA